MTKVNVISGFLGAGKTTLIKKLLDEALRGEKIVLIENEFGEIGIDGGFLKDAGIEISEMNSGCICCSLVALHQVMDQFRPDRILIEPSGVGKLSDVVRAVQDVAETEPEMALGCAVTVADAGKCRVYLKNFGEFYANQIEHAGAVILSRTQKLDGDRLEAAVALLREKNGTAPIVTTPWDQLTGAQLLAVMEGGDTLALLAEEEACPVCGGHHHHGHEHGEHACGCGGHEHGHEEHECCHHGHEHGHEEHECGCHGHDHEHHHHHHGHDAGEVFSSWGVETTRAFTAERLEHILTELDGGRYGAVLRCKGIVPGQDGGWLHFDYVPEEHQIRSGPADYTGRLCVIGSGLDEAGLKALFEV